MKNIKHTFVGFWFFFPPYTKHLLSRSVALITSAATFDHSTLSQVKIEIWFADVFWLTPAGKYAVAGRGSSLVYPYKFCFSLATARPIFQSQSVLTE